MLFLIDSLDSQSAWKGSSLTWWRRVWQGPNNHSAGRDLHKLFRVVVNPSPQQLADQERFNRENAADLAADPNLSQTTRPPFLQE